MLCYIFYFFCFVLLNYVSARVTRGDRVKDKVTSWSKFMPLEKDVIRNDLTSIIDISNTLYAVRCIDQNYKTVT